jgi:polysaccharide export outer membrane protein
MKVDYGDVKIMPGDVIAIATYAAPELSTTGQTSASTISSATAGSAQGVKVGSQGEISLPYLGPVKIAGLTPTEAAAFLAKALKDGGILVDPQVSVELVESPTRIITVLGEVLRPAPVPSFGQLRLLDVISACGGLTPLASHRITIRRPGEADPITVELGADPKSTNVSDIPLMAGDTVIVPKVGNVFVVGEVKAEAAYPLSSNAPVTVMRAISMAGGLKYSAALSKARIIRTTADNQHVEIMLDLKKLMLGKQQDIALAADDVLFIPANGFKAAASAGGAQVAVSAFYGVVDAAALLR